MRPPTPPLFSAVAAKVNSRWHREDEPLWSRQVIFTLVPLNTRAKPPAVVDGRRAASASHIQFEETIRRVRRREELLIE